MNVHLTGLPSLAGFFVLVRKFTIAEELNFI